MGTKMRKTSRLGLSLKKKMSETAKRKRIKETSRSEAKRWEGMIAEWR